MAKYSFFKKILWLINGLLTVPIVLGWLVYYLPPLLLTPLSIVSLVLFPLLVLHFLFLLYWLAKRSKKAFLSFAVLGVSLLVFGSSYRFANDETEPSENSVSLMSYNIRRLSKYEKKPIASLDSLIMQFLSNEAPDILILQEAHRTMRKETPLDKIYPYKFVDYEYGVRQYTVINALYSKYPILDVQIINFPNSSNAAIYADLELEKDTVRVYNVHLQSFKITPNVEELQNEPSGKLLKRIMRVLKRQEEQALLVKQHAANSPYPTMLVGDFNNTQFSKTYRYLGKGLTDSFFEKGAAMGRTYELFKLPMRIDYIFLDNNFEVKSHTNYDIELSDHYPVKAEFILHSNK